MRKVCCVQAKTLKFSPHVQLHKVTYGPKYGPPRPLATDTKNSQKTPEIRFSHKMAAKSSENYFWFRFSAIFQLSTLNLLYVAKNRKIFSGALFRDIWGQS